MTACPRCHYDPHAVILASWSFHIPRDIASMNSHTVNNRAGWAYRKERDGWASDLRVIRTTQRIPEASTKRRVTITRVYIGRQQEMDYANLVGGAKACVDALKIAGLIVDDAPAWLEDCYAQLRGGFRGTSFLVEEIA